MPEELPAELREFVAAKFGSAEQLDIFVLLFRHAERGWSPEQVAAELGMAPQSAGMRLYLLASAGLLVAGGGAEAIYQYVADPGLDPLARWTEAVYATRRDELHRIVSAAPRPDPAQHFADAFKWRKP
jgi:hypothetical protein